MQKSIDLTATDLTVPQVAAELGLHYDTVRRLLIAGHLAGYKADLKQWRVTRAALDHFKASGGARPVGRPRREEQEMDLSKEQAR